MRKKSIAMVLAVVMVLAGVLTGCGNSNTEQKEPIKVGLVQLVEHPSLDTIRENIISEMKSEGYEDGKAIKLDYKNAQNEMANLKTICQGFVSGEYDVIIAITTPAAQAAYGETKDIPIVFSAVTDPVAAGLVKDFKAPGGNITGTSDLVSADKIVDLAKKITPDVKTIGTLYNSSEVNSQSVVNDLKDYAKKNNLKVKEAAVTNASEIQQAAQSLTNKCDAVFLPIDNTVASAMSVAADVFNGAKLPVYVGADSMVKDGGLATYGINYESLGKETGKMAVQVIEGEDTKAMPVKVMDDMEIYYNEATADAIGLKLPKTIVEKGTNLGE
ncbi:MAG: ABC transporter substrate-binding protein [Anaerovoracaceae bacterium]